MNIFFGKILKNIGGRLSAFTLEGLTYKAFYTTNFINCIKPVQIFMTYVIHYHYILDKIGRNQTPTQVDPNEQNYSASLLSFARLDKTEQIVTLL